MSAAAATAATAAAPEAPPKKKSKKLLFIILGVVVLALIGAAAALFILKSKAADDEEGAEGEEEHVAEVHSKDPKTAPVFLPLENMVINLADPGGNRFIQLGLTLQLQDTATETAVKAYLPSIRSNTLVLISQRTAEEMLQVTGKEKLAQDIIATISREMGYEMPEKAGAEGNAPVAKKKKTAKPAPNPVQAVLFSSFIVQ